MKGRPAGATHEVGSVPEGLSDEALLAGLAAGHRASTAAFIRRHQSHVYGAALGMLADPALAEDVAQEVFLRAWRHAGAYDPRRGAVRTWLMTITRNLAIDALRMRRSLPVDPQSVVLSAVSPEPDPADMAALGGDIERLHRAMAELPEPQRRALSLAVLKGLTMEEIGRVEAIPTGTAKTRIRAAMTKLRAVMAEEAGS